MVVVVEMVVEVVMVLEEMEVGVDDGRSEGR